LGRTGLPIQQDGVEALLDEYVVVISPEEHPPRVGLKLELLNEFLGVQIHNFSSAIKGTQ
jgi:hypothetical protein